MQFPRVVLLPRRVRVSVAEELHDVQLSAWLSGYVAVDGYWNAYHFHGAASCTAPDVPLAP
jgi:hypothetical protein